MIQRGAWLLKRAIWRFRTVTPLVVVCSDDWGADAMTDHCEETAADVRAVGDALAGLRDAAGRCAVLSAFLVAARPDFAAIAAGGFRTYRWVPSYAGREGLVRAWQEGAERGVFTLEFHGRDHFNCLMWLEELRANSRPFVEAFRNGRVYYKGPSWKDEVSRRPSLAYFSREFIDRRQWSSRPLTDEVQAKSVAEGVEAFRATFGRSPGVAVAAGSAWDTGTERAFRAAGLRYVAVGKQQHFGIDADGNLRSSPRFTGERTANGLVLVVHNVDYEPGWESSRPGRALDVAEEVLRKAEALIAARHPVVLCTHSMNYTGDSSRRDECLDGLGHTLNGIMARYPQTLFASAAELAALACGRSDEVPGALREALLKRSAP